MSQQSELNLYGTRVRSHFFLGTAGYPSLQTLQQAIAASATEVITVSLRRELGGGKQSTRFWQLLKEFRGHILPNTAGCLNADEAINVAQMAREIFATDWIKLEVIADNYTLAPDPEELVNAARQLVGLGFKVFPYMSDDLALAVRLVDAGCRVLMPWGSYIGSGQGIRSPEKILAIKKRFPEIPIVIDAGIGKPSQAAFGMEIGADAVLLNTAVAKAIDPVAMANCFRIAIENGRRARDAGIMPETEMAVASSPVSGKPFHHFEGEGV